MRRIQKTFKPEYLTLGDQIGNKLLSWGEKAGANLSPEQKKGVADRAVFFQKTFDSVNRAIRDMTGAQMSESEADRLMRGMPNQDDSPTEFVAKISAVIEEIELYASKYKETLREGIPLGTGADELDSLSEEDLDSILSSMRGAQ